MTPPCQLDATDYCQRHGTRHIGHLRAIALGEDAKSAAFRAKWDARAGKTSQPAAKHAPCAGLSVRAAPAGGKKPAGAKFSLPVPEDITAARLAQCYDCTFWNTLKAACKHRNSLNARRGCQQCNTDPTSQTARCPEGKWDRWQYLQHGYRWDDAAQAWTPPPAPLPTGGERDA